MELRVAQPRLGDAIQWGRDDAAEGARHAVALVVGHDEQHVGRALGGTTVAIRLGIRGGFLDHAAELQRRRGVFPVIVTVVLGEPGP